MSTMYSEEKLIENVRTHTSLYDVFSVDYKDQNIRKEAWKEIGEVLQMPAEKCKSDWTKLRNCFLNSIRRRRNKTSGQFANHIPPWKFSQQMEFLLPFLENRETYSNIEVHNQDESPIEIPDTENNTSYNLPESQEDQPTDNELNDSLVTPPKGPIKKKKTNYNEEMVELMRSNAAFRREKYEKRAYNNMNHDEVELFYLSMAKIAKRLPKAKEAKLRMEICNRVSQAELDHLLGVETMQQQQQPQESNKNKVLSHQNIRNYQNQSSLFQRPISRSFVEESNSMSSFSNHSDQSSILNYSNEEPNYSRPPPNNFLVQPIFDDTNDTVKSFSTYEHL